MKFEDGKYYWVKDSRHSDWKIAEYSLVWDRFKFQKGKEVPREWCFEIDPKPIERLKQ